VKWLWSRRIASSLESTGKIEFFGHNLGARSAYSGRDPAIGAPSPVTDPLSVYQF
jgi:hypothetical protein